MRLFPLLVLFAISAVTYTQQDPIQDFCRRHQHQTCVIDNKLYIDGGKVYYGGTVENGSTAQQNKRLLWENVLATDNATAFPIQYKNLTKETEVPSVSGGVLWPDTSNKLFYLFGGEYEDISDVQPFNTPWFFDVIYNTWNRSAASNTQAGISWPAFGAGAVSEGGIAYYYGGYLNNKTTPGWGAEPLMLASLISFDMDTQLWSNRSFDNVRRAEGTLHYLPASKDGLLVYFGGVETDSNGATRYANISVIRVFDIAENKWFTQVASGDAPSPRRGLCAGVIWAKDRSSYNFYVQGGIGEAGLTFGETYILSIPSFQWKLIYPEPNLIPNTAYGKAWSSCNVVRDSQMIVMGGYAANTSWHDCDVKDVMGQHGLLLGQESEEVKSPQTKWWWQLWPDYNEYRVPDTIVSLIGGNVSGYATKTAPLQGWTTPSLVSYFQGENYVIPRTATRSLPASGTGKSEASPPSSDGPNVGAIAGGTVGGLVALIALIAIILLCLRRRRRKEVPRSETELDTSTRPELDGPVMAQKHITNYSMSDGGTAYSPQASSLPGTNSYYQGSPPQQGGEWTQPYYPPPPEPSVSPKRLSPLEASAELPDVRSPANAELAEIRSPVNAELPDMRYPASARGI